MTFQQFMSLVEAERQSQRARHTQDDLHTPNNWIAIITRQVGLAASDGGEHDPERFLRQMVRVAATAAAAYDAINKGTQPADKKVAGYTPEPWRMGV